MDVNTTDKCWLAVQVRPRYEMISAGILKDKGYEQYVPLYRSMRQWSDRKKEISLPLFTGYVFCRFSPDVFGPILTTYGVIRIIRSGENFAHIEDAEIERIRAVENCKLNVQPCPYLKLGDRVRINDGPLSGIEGVLSSFKNRNHLVVSIKTIQGSIAVDVEGWTVTPIKTGADRVLPDSGVAMPPCAPAPVALA